LLLLNPDRAWATAELIERLDATPATAHRELHRALASGLIVREGVGQTYLYRAASDSPLFAPMRDLLEKTVGVEMQISRALQSVPGIEAAFIHGSFADNNGIRPRSDVDLLVLGEVDPHALRRQLRQIERGIGRTIDVTLYSPKEFDALFRSGNSFARGIVRGPTKPLVGTLDDLPSVA
jgi:predicted nucleotidyltransferase